MQSLELLRQPLERESVLLLYQTGLKKTKTIQRNNLIDKQLQLAKSIDNKAFEHLELDEMWNRGHRLEQVQTGILQSGRSYYRRYSSYGYG